ncbi:Holliday junction DNA helicase RuvA [Mesonia hippocampi]|uniref:Holliday junction branch migration complex subunit RuvA n=1 Tax=Mesonia hippocampi TaxID=1628250 RepID=A0A840EKX8_9FLAO|nr:Holliday junction branch migration protein RuvA [Mesonia hippocampi]MBB4118788.1 Holliday junction DNA helicase RuvA [Mesonia hippocampi]
MITHLQGKLVEKNPTELVVECNGVGYLLHISLYTYEQLGTDENIKIFTHLLVREDAQTLYGFAQTTERDLFLKLISVSGIGAGTARTMLSSLSPEQIIQAIASEDVNTIKGVKGIGLKTAQRVIIDLKDKLNDVATTANNLVLKGNTNQNEALSALETLGYTKKQSQKVIENIVKQEPEASVETIIKLALKKL